MFIRLDGIEITGHDTTSHGDFSVEVPDQILVDIRTGVYKFQYIDGELVPLDQATLDARNAPYLVEIPEPV